MPKFKGAGRPRRSLAPPNRTLTARVRRLIDLAHSGKVRDASRLTGIPYPTLNDLYNGRSVNPNLATLEAFCVPYQIGISWLLSDDEPNEVPRKGIVANLPPDANADVKRRSLRQVHIPFSAWPMCEVFTTLEYKLERMDANADRPIVGEASGDALRFRLATFLFQPLLAAERAGEKETFVGSAEGDKENAELLERWSNTLAALGEMWRVGLPSLLSDSADNTPVSDGGGT